MIPKEVNIQKTSDNLLFYRSDHHPTKSRNNMTTFTALYKQIYRNLK